MKTIGSVCEVTPGKTPGKVAYALSGDIKMVKFRDVLESGTVDYTTDQEGWFDSRYADESDLIDLQPATILLTNAAHSVEHIGKKVAYVETVPNMARRVCFVGELTSIRARADSGYSTKWIYYWLQTNDAKSAVAKCVEGAHLVPRQFRRAELPNCSPHDQAAQLELLALVDVAIGKARVELTAAKELLKALLKTLFELGVVTPKGLHHSKWTICPAHWKIQPLKKIATVQSGFTMGRDLSRAETVKVPYVTVVNVQDGHVDLTNIASIEIKREELSTDTLRYGDILMTEGGDRDKLGRGGMWRNEIDPCSYQNHIFRVRLEQDYKPALFHFLIQTYQAKNYFYAHAKQTSNLCTINSRELKNWPVAIPPIEEQETMVELLEAAERTCSAVQSRVTKLLDTKRSLLQNLLTGKTRIPEGATHA